MSRSSIEKKKEDIFPLRSLLSRPDEEIAAEEDLFRVSEEEMADDPSMQGTFVEDTISFVKQPVVRENVQEHEQDAIISDEDSEFHERLVAHERDKVISIKEPHEKLKEHKLDTVISVKDKDANEKVQEHELDRDHKTILRDETAPQDIADDTSTGRTLDEDTIFTVKEPDVLEKVQEHKEDSVISVRETNVHEKVDQRTPQVGMFFKSLEEAIEFYDEYARHEGFGIKISHSQYGDDGKCKIMILACSKQGKGRNRSTNPYLMRPSQITNCKARIRVRTRDDGLFILASAYLEHNHEVTPSKAPITRLSRKFNGLKKQPEYTDEGIQPNKSCPIHDAQAGECKNLPSGEKECCNCFRSLMQLKLAKDDAEALHQYFNHMQTRNSSFFYLMDLDEGGCLKNVFWADGRSRAAYQLFGDVISFDTTCLTGKYDMPLALFVGVNHHGQPVLLGCGLLSNENIETYVWLFKAWLSCMSERPPNAIITDQCKAIQRAVLEVFPRARHRLCLWHIMKKIPEILCGYAEYKEITRELMNIVFDSLRVDEFEENWSKINEHYGLEDNGQLKLLYDNRHCWVPVFVQDTFWAGMSIMEHTGVVNFFFDEYVHSKTSLKQFLSKYEVALQNKYKKEAQADFDSFHKTPQLISQLYMEEQLCKMYTINMFKKFQDEVKALICCHPLLVKVDGSVSTFEVKERVRMKDSEKTENKNYEVLYNENGQEVQCICHSFHFRGILCRHALSVLNFQDVSEIPSQYIIERWRKDFKHVHALPLSSNELVADGLVERYDNLYRSCLEFAEVGAISNDKYFLAMKILREGKEKLLVDDSICKGLLPETLPCETMASELNLKRKEPVAVRNNNTNKIKASRRTPKFDNQIDVFPIAPTISYFGSHIGMQESISSMEQVDATHFPVSTQFAVPMNHQHAINSQLRTQWSFEHMQQAPPGPRTG